LPVLTCRERIGQYALVVFGISWTIGTILAGVNSIDQLVDTDYQRLSGTWVLSSGVVDGHPVPEEIRKKTRLITTRDKFTLSTGAQTGTSEDGTFTIDPTKSPKTVDSVQGSGLDKGKTFLGIYEIIDDTHKRACWAPAGKPRPTDFVSTPGSGYILQVWKRERP
jgi:uncharacterized protein (TIGR03067 family)